MSPTPTQTPAPSVTPSPTPPVFMPAIFTVSGSPGLITASHSGVLDPPTSRHFVAFWSRNGNSQANMWSYLGFVEYLDGEQSTVIGWSGPDMNTRHELAARLFVEGVGFSGPTVYGILSDLPEVFPAITGANYDDGLQQLDVSLSAGGLTSSLGTWSRRLFVPAGPVPSPAVEIGNWTYHGVAPIDLGDTLVSRPFNRGADSYTLASAIFVKGQGFVLPHLFANAPETDVIYPDLKLVTADSTNGAINLEFRPAGNQPAEIAVWFREMDSGSCTPLCDWTFFGMFPYELDRRDQVIPWNPGTMGGTYQVAVRLHADDGMFSGFIDNYVYWLGCAGPTGGPGLPFQTEKPGPDWTSGSKRTPTPTPTVTPYTAFKPLDTIPAAERR